ncbi:hypothetical protein [Anaerococcus sp.]|uniref:hypothetical protein n=1 Tax=Anaerococcus sp. TaxID=1872515 RepID=UPI002A74FD28|nr:hypothetical protein [Anaerococcus sp.]MDD7305782.1 hypothetical protein [Peptoniphilaceae bacterium]MDY2928286.1 hypothetical protein [Anaerococcus sp.]
MGEKKGNRSKFIELANKNFTDKDVFIKFSYKEIDKEKVKLLQGRNSLDNNRVNNKLK